MSLRVVALAYEGLCLFEFALAAEVFALPRQSSPSTDTTEPSAASSRRHYELRAA